MMKLMNKKMGKNEKGFTLAELLIVVAIVAVLVAISIPIFNSKLEEAREATDVANMRAAKAAAVVQYLGDGKEYSGYYDAEAGTLVKEKPTATYGKGTGADGGTKYMTYKGETEAADKVLEVEIDEDGDVTLEWE